MALRAADLIPLEFSPDLTQAGIDAVRRRLPSLGARSGGIAFNALRGAVAQNAAQLALLRYLSSQDIPHQMNEVSGLDLGGRSSQLVVDFVTQKRRISELSSKTAAWLDRPLPSFSRDSRAELFLFMGLAGLVTKGRDDLEAADEAGQPHFLLYPTPKLLARPAAWRPLAELTLKLEKGADLELELAGQDEGRHFVTENVALAAGKPVQAQDAFYSLTHLHAAELPEGRVALHNADLDSALVIHSKDWGNLWVYGLQLVLLGFTTNSEFVDLSKAGKAKVGALRPMAELFGRVQAWARGKTQA